MTGSGTRARPSPTSGAGLTGLARGEREAEARDRPEDSQPRLMVVEDETLVAHDLAETLRSLDYEVARVVGDGEDAVSAAGEVEFDLILMDIRLGGGMSGVEAARRIGSRSDVPVVYTTAHAGDETLGEAVRSGPYGYVVKPYTDDSLRCAIEVALARHRSERDTRDREWWLRQMMDHSRDVVAVLDERGEAEYVNSAVGSVLGLAPKEIEDTSVLERVHPDDQPEARDALDRCVDAPGETVEVDVRIRHARGGWRRINAVGRSIRGPSGRTHVLVSARESARIGGGGAGRALAARG